MNVQKLNRIDDIVNKEISENSIAGASVLVVKDGKIKFRKEYGYADKAEKKLISSDTIFRLFSMTKPITAVAAMILFERGEIDFEYPVSRYLNGFDSPKVLKDGKLYDAERQITVRDLMNMTSGIVYPGGWFEAGAEMQKLYDDVKARQSAGECITTRQFAEMIGSKPLMFSPGESWTYGAGCDVMGAVIEKICGAKLSEFMKEEIFDRLGMKDTAFYVPKEKRDRFAQIYYFDEKCKKLRPFKDNYLCLTDYKAPPAFESAGAGLVSTVDDYLNFASMLLNKGEYAGQKILGRKTVEFMTSNQMNAHQMPALNYGATAGYGYGAFMRILVDPAAAATNASVGEYGWDGWTGNYFTVDPKENLIFMYFIQKCGTGCNDITRRLRQIVYGAVE